MIIVLLVKRLFIFKSFSKRKIEENVMYLFTVKVLIKGKLYVFNYRKRASF